MNAPTPRYILHKGSSHGLGNRLHVLSYAIELARKSRAKLLIHWDDHCYANQENSFGVGFELTGLDYEAVSNAQLEALGTLESTEAEWSGNYHLTAEHVRAALGERRSLGNADLQDISDISGLLTQTAPTPQKPITVICGYARKRARPHLLRKHLRLSPAFKERLRLDVAKHMSLTESPYCGIHVRSAAGDVFSKPDYHYISSILKRQQFDGPIYFACDSSQEIQRAQEILGSRLIPGTQLFPSTPHPSLKIEPLGLHRVSDQDALFERKEDLLYEALRDLYFLSQSSILFTQPISTFSDIASCFFKHAPFRNFQNSRPTMIGQSRRILRHFIVEKKGLRTQDHWLA